MKAKLVTIPSFETEEDAAIWMSEIVDDPSQDSYRFAYDSDDSAVDEYNNIAVAEYNKIADSGCRGFFDRKVIVNSKPARIGCNYGH